jgi:hypothetical protein
MQMYKKEFFFSAFCLSVVLLLFSKNDKLEEEKTVVFPIAKFFSSFRVYRSLEITSTISSA